MDWLAVWGSLFGHQSGRLLGRAKIVKNQLSNYASLEDEVKLNLAQLLMSFWTARKLLQRINDPSFLITFQILANLWKCTQNVLINLQKFVIIRLFRYFSSLIVKDLPS
jgi:hypothetical protein